MLKVRVASFGGVSALPIRAAQAQGPFHKADIDAQHSVTRSSAAVQKLTDFERVFATEAEWTFFLSGPTWSTPAGPHSSYWGTSLRSMLTSWGFSGVSFGPW